MSATTLGMRPASTTLNTLGITVRFVAALAISGLITLGLFLLMRALVWVDVGPVDPTIERPVIQISMIPDEHEVVEPMTPEPVELVTVPPLVRPDPVAAQDRPVDLGSTGIGPVEVTPNTSSIGTISRLPPPVTVRIAPAYPPRELQRGIEGSCVVQYDVLGNGRTANARVLSCDSRGFAQASLAAVADWRHSVVFGDDPNAIVNRGLQTQLDFRLDG